MGRYTALDDPIVDRTIESHLETIVKAVLARMAPQAIILRGSFGRGEGSVMNDAGKLRFLSDYEIDVATYTPRYRPLFAELSQKLTAEFGVQTGLRWVRPDYIDRDRIGPIPLGTAPITISLYEIRNGSRTLYGQDFIQSSRAIDPDQIHVESGLILVLNRMAESLLLITTEGNPAWDEIDHYYWINKTILSCAESLLLVWKQFHFSYAERGRRFSSLASTHLDFMQDQAAGLSELVARATEFKLRPRQGLYKDSVRDEWSNLIPICDTVFRYLAHQILGIRFNSYTEYPERYLQGGNKDSKDSAIMLTVLSKSLELYKYLRSRSIPRGLLSSYPKTRIIYALVPMLFVGRECEPSAMPEMQSEVRRWLNLVCKVEPPDPDEKKGWESLQRQLFWAWKNFCVL